MANPKKPDHLKVISGTDQPCRMDDDSFTWEALGELPPCPEWLPNVHSVREWKRLGMVLVANKLLTEASLGAFAQLCAIHGKLVQLYSAGECPNSSMIQQYRGLIGEFGLTPVAQNKLKHISKSQVAANRFNRLG
jgi:phage terminase small subunit